MARKPKATVDDLPIPKPPWTKTDIPGNGNIPNLPGYPGNTIGNRWKKGESGNPAGRPRSSTEMKQRAASLTDLAVDVIQLAAQLTRARLQAAVDLARDPNAHPEQVLAAATALEKCKTGIEAAREILDRGHGKPQQKLEVKSQSVIDEMHEDELAEFIVTLGAQVTGILKAKRR